MHGHAILRVSKKAADQGQRGHYLEFIKRWSSCKDNSLVVESRINDAVTVASKICDRRDTQLKINYTKKIYIFILR